MPRTMDVNDDAIYRARFTLIYPPREDGSVPEPYTSYFGPFRTPGSAQAAVTTEIKSRSGSRLPYTFDTEIEVANLVWRKHERASES